MTTYIFKNMKTGEVNDKVIFDSPKVTCYTDNLADFSHSMDYVSQENNWDLADVIAESETDPDQHPRYGNKVYYKLVTLD